jgi:ABC-type uncharacterized transport system ATPase subunit
LKSIDFSHIAVEMKGITRRFGAVLANDNISLTVHRGEVHALLGENGAGKTTLMNILYGLLKPTSGSVEIEGRPVNISSPSVAIQNGIGMVHQHFMLVGPFSVTQNIILGKEPTGKFGMLDMGRARDEVVRLSALYGLDVDPDSPVEDLSVGSQQRVEILKTLYRGARILILDEPTAVLTPPEIQELITIIRNLTEAGKTIIIITHKLAEIKQIADFCTIIRRGRQVETVAVGEVSLQGLAEKMVGREVNFTVEKEKCEPGETILEVRDLHVEDSRGVKVVNGLNLQVRKGEILGVAGVDGNGQSQLIEAIAGLRKACSGKVLVRGEEITGLSVRKIINDCKVGHIPEDRQKRGLVLEFDVAENMVLETYGKPPFSRWFTLFWKTIYEHGDRLMARFDVRPRNAHLPARALSGGNQQKMIIAREVANEPELLIAAQPTRGLDVGAIEYVHQALVAERDRGKGILLVSFELDEVLALADRIAVIFEGRITGEFEAGEADEKAIGYLMSGGRP